MSSFSTNPVAPESESSLSETTELLNKLKSTPDKNLMPLIEEVSREGAIGLHALMQFLQERRENTDLPQRDIVAGKIYQVLLASNNPSCADFLQTQFPEGVVPLRSQANIDYHPLQTLLAKQDFQAADQLTLQKLCELAGTSAVQRKWVYFTEVEQFPALDLQTINTLWLVHSEGKFGFSVQRELWLSVGRNWDKLWPKIGWKEGINWTRYPQGFIWDLSAPKGHLPLSNQLRGVRVMASLMAHPAWNAEQ